MTHVDHFARMASVCFDAVDGGTGRAGALAVLQAPGNAADAVPVNANPMSIFLRQQANHEQSAMKNWWTSILRRMGFRRPGRDDVLGIAKVVGPKIDNTVNDLFEAFGERLMKKPPVYVVPAIWGSDKSGEIRPLQRQINEKVAPVIRELEKAFDNGRLNEAQLFGIAFLARGMMISKLLYMLEAARGQWRDFPDTEPPEEESENSLVRMKPIGNA